MARVTVATASWTQATAATTQFIVQNVGSYPVWVRLSATDPGAGVTDGHILQKYDVMPQGPTPAVLHAWVRAESAGEVDVQED